MLRYSLKIHEDAAADIETLWSVEPRAAAAIVALLEQAEIDQRTLESFTIKDYGAGRTEKFHVDWWWTQYKTGRNLWRVKIWNLESRRLNYRIIYALDPRQTRYYVLGILPREFDYDATNERSRRLLAAYDELGIPNY